MMPPNSTSVTNKFCIITTQTITETELNKLTWLGLRAEDIHSETQRDKGDRNPVIEETGYVGMTTRFGIRVLGISFRAEFINDS